jgi:acyl-coenzyme A synthetase/AMP-(fatty) acid ligase
MGLIGPDSMPSLRYSFFCGEALPASLAVAWMWAAPHSRVFNLYGPTEATIAFSSFDIGSHSDIPHAIVPLGFPIGTQQMDVSAEGELLLSGSQLSSGYILDEEKTAQSFFKHEGRRWYRTGDRAEFDERYGFIFKGRLDSQIKVRGYRVETGEVEVALRKAVGSDLVAVLPVREVGPNTYEGLIGVVCGGLTDMEAARVALREILPEYMCPEKVIAVPDMPKNSNDKVDYIALKTMLSGQV